VSTRAAVLRARRKVGLAAVARVAVAVTDRAGAPAGPARAARRTRAGAPARRTRPGAATAAAAAAIATHPGAGASGRSAGTPGGGLEVADVREASTGQNAEHRERSTLAHPDENSTKQQATTKGYNRPVSEKKRGKRRGVRKRRGAIERSVKRVRMGAENALEIMRLGRLAERRGVPFEITHRDANYKLRHYAPELAVGTDRPPLVLIPPLMLTAEIYDVAPDLSAVDTLAARGIDTWVIDFGAPEREEGGMHRTLDDHVRAVADAIRRVRAATGRDVHLAGYSQGGMFAYQACAYLGSEGVASLITFGSPVDTHKSLPRVSQNLTARLIRVLEPVVGSALKRIEGLPGFLTSTGFKLLSPVKEVEQLFDFVKKLHDRQALEKREIRRRFLAGEGFVAWPGPALLKFIDEFIVHNRMVRGGFVIDGKSVTLADIRSPVLYFVGSRDDIARPAMVRAITRAIPGGELYEATVPAGHFGLVVGSTAMRDTWPTVIEWLKWREGAGARPRLLAVAEPDEPMTAEEEEIEVEDAAFDEPIEVELFSDAVRGTAEQLWRRLGERFEDLGESVDNLRFQVPRLTRLRDITAETRVSFASSLAEQAEKIPERTFFLWKGRAFSYADANRRVESVTRGLLDVGVRPGQHVAVVMRGRPSHLSMVTALNRIGAVAVLISPDVTDADLERALALDTVQLLATDPENAERARRVYPGKVIVLGGGGPNRELPSGVIDLERIDPDAVRVPEWYRPNPGLAEDLALVFVTVGHGTPGRAARITNRRWAFSALGAAAACTLAPRDTVYCCLPLHHPAGLLVSVGSALVAGSQLALATEFEPAVFWSEVRRYGATVAFYAGELCRQLVNAPPSAAELSNPLRMFAGSGIRADVWREVVGRFDAGVLEFYASTEGNLVLANAAGDKIGALGRPLPGTSELALVAWDFEHEDFERDAQGHARSVDTNEPGLLVARLETGTAGEREARVLEGLFEPGDRWFVTGDLLRRDEDGDYWFVDRASDVIRTAAGPVHPRALEDTLYGLGDVALACVYDLELPGVPGEVVAAAIVPKAGREIDLARLLGEIELHHAPRDRPEIVRVLDEMALTDGFRPIKPLLRQAGLGGEGRTFRYDPSRRSYVPLAENRAALAI
jgi:putative long chain acyl-CoA synthase